MTKQMKKLKKNYNKFYEVIWGNGSAVSGAIDLTDILSLLDAVDGVLKRAEQKETKRIKFFEDFINFIAGLMVGVFCAILLKIIFGLLFGG